MSDFPPPLQPPLPPPLPEAPVNDTVGRGIGIAFLWTVGAGIAGGMTMAIGIGAVIVLGIGLVQLAYILPLRKRYLQRGQPETAKGLLIAAGIVFLLNAGCWGTLVLTLSSASFH